MKTIGEKGVPGSDGYWSATQPRGAVLRTWLTLSMGSVLATTAFFGCRANQGPERVVVAGTVTYRGEPIKRGVIRFVPSRGTISARIRRPDSRWQVRMHVPRGSAGGNA